jgi:nucleotide-binding universal stress UspA family protein
LDRILVFTPPEDRAGRAIALATSLAGRTGAPLLLVRVLEESSSRGLQDPDEAAPRALRDLLIEAENEALEALAGPMRDRGLEVSTQVSWGVPWEVVTHLVRSQACSLVVKPARGLAKAGRVFFGSTALHLFRKCPCPVWVVGDHGRLPAKILAAIDPASDATRRAVARRVLGLARAVADRADARLEIASAWHAPGARLLEGRISKSELNEYIDDARGRAAEALHEIIRECVPSLPPDRAHLLAGKARDALPRFAEEQEFDLIVIGTLARVGVAGDLLGETAEEIARAVRSSVLTVAPPAAPSEPPETIGS